MPENYLQILNRINSFFFDVDGVLTDGSVTLMPGGEQVRVMNVKDGSVIHGLKNVFPYMEKYNPRIYNSYKVLSLNAGVGGSEISDIINMLHGAPINKISEIKIFIKKITDECNIV